MEPMKTKLDIDILQEYAKEVVKERGDHMPMFFIQKNDDSIEIMPADMSDKERMHATLSKYVKENDVETYYMVYTGWMAQKNPKELKNKLKHLKKKPTKQKMEQFIESCIQHYATRPSESPNKKEILVTSKHSKKNGIDARYVEILRENEEDISFSKPEDLTNQKGTVFNQWDVWNIKQVTL